MKCLLPGIFITLSLIIMTIRNIGDSTHSLNFRLHRQQHAAHIRMLNDSHAALMTGSTSLHTLLGHARERALHGQRALGSVSDAAPHQQPRGAARAVQQVFLVEPASVGAPVAHHIAREHIVEVCQHLRDDQDLRFELSLGVSGVHYPADEGREPEASARCLYSYLVKRTLPKVLRKCEAKVLKGRDPRWAGWGWLTAGRDRTGGYVCQYEGDHEYEAGL